MTSLEAEVIELLQPDAGVLQVRPLKRLADGEVVGEDGVVPGALPFWGGELAFLCTHPAVERGRLLQLQAEQIMGRCERA